MPAGKLPRCALLAIPINCVLTIDDQALLFKGLLWFCEKTDWPAQMIKNLVMLRATRIEQ